MKELMKVFSSDSAVWERMENDRIAKRVYVREYTGSYSMGFAWSMNP